MLILGAGHIGRAIALLLEDAGSYTLTVADRDAAALKRLQASSAATLQVTDDAMLEAAIAGHHAVLNALPFHQAVPVATLCARHGVHYFDLTEDVASTRAIQALAEGARSAFMLHAGWRPASSAWRATPWRSAWTAWKRCNCAWGRCRATCRAPCVTP